MGGVGGVGGARRVPNYTAYYVALGGVVLLLVMLCCYFVYFCVGRVLELSKDESLVPQSRTPQSRTPQSRTPQSGASQLASTPAPPPRVVRESAQAMAAMCRQHSAR